MTDGWLYLVTVTGTTGVRSGLSSSLAGLAERARAAAPGVALYAGFGISTPADARAAAELTDGVVVGSRALEAAEEGPRSLRDYVRSLRDALDPWSRYLSAMSESLRGQLLVAAPILSDPNFRRRWFWSPSTARRARWASS